jgi:hypothetical protein
MCTRHSYEGGVKRAPLNVVRVLGVLKQVSCHCKRGRFVGVILSYSSDDTKLVE